MRGYQALCLQDGGHIQYTERGHAKQMLKTRFYFNFIMRYYSGTDTQGSKEFTVF